MSKRTQLLAVALVAAGLVVGCSSDGGDDAVETTVQPSGATGTDGTDGTEASEPDGEVVTEGETRGGGESGGGGSEDLPDARDDPESSTSSGDGTGGCEGYDGADPDVVGANCNGTATVRFTVDGTAHEIVGGTCERFGDFFNVNAGVLLFPTTEEQEEPDHVVIQLPLADGEFGPGDGASVGVAVDGLSYLAEDATGSHDATSATFEGVDDFEGVTIAGTVTC